MFKCKVIQKLNRIERMLEVLLAVSNEIKDLVAKIDAATNDVAARIDRLSGQIHNSMTDAEVNEVKAGLQAEIDRLTGLGKDPANPVPAPPTP